MAGSRPMGFMPPVGSPGSTADAVALFRMLTAYALENDERGHDSKLSDDEPDHCHKLR